MSDRSSGAFFVSEVAISHKTTLRVNVNDAPGVQRTDARSPLRQFIAFARRHLFFLTYNPPFGLHRIRGFPMTISIRRPRPSMRRLVSFVLAAAAASALAACESPLGPSNSTRSGYFG